MKKTERSSVRLEIEIPKGPLFYPCCGNDTLDPIRTFLGSLPEFHFVDIWDIGLPDTRDVTKPGQVERIFSNQETYQVRQGERGNFLQSWSISSGNRWQKEISKEAVENAKGIADNPEEVRVNGNTSIYEETWEHKRSGKKSKIICHKADGVVTLLELPKIAVFFYRGDSMGEGGSGQWWLGPKLFNLVLDKLLEGGLMITDGSNLDPLYTLAEWSSLWTNKTDFVYKGKLFINLGPYPSFDRRRETHVWKVVNVASF